MTLTRPSRSQCAFCAWVRAYGLGSVLGRRLPAVHQHGGKQGVIHSRPLRAVAGGDQLVESDPRVSFPDTGSAQEDLRLQISRVATLFSDPAFSKPFVGLLAESQHDPVLADALHQWLITARRAGAAEVLRRGIERGELRADLDVNVAIDTLYGAIYYRLLVSHQPLSTEYARNVVDEVFAGLQAPSKPAR